MPCQYRYHHYWYCWYRVLFLGTHVPVNLLSLAFRVCLAALRADRATIQFLPLVQTRKQKPREGRGLAQGYAAGEWHSGPQTQTPRLVQASLGCTCGLLCKQVPAGPAGASGRTEAGIPDIPRHQGRVSIPPSASTSVSRG